MYIRNGRDILYKKKIGNFYKYLLYNDNFKILFLYSLIDLAYYQENQIFIVNITGVTRLKEFNFLHNYFKYAFINMDLLRLANYSLYVQRV